MLYTKSVEFYVKSDSIVRVRMLEERKEPLYEIDIIYSLCKLLIPILG